MSSLLRAYVQNKSYKDAVKEFYDTLAEIDAAKHFLFLAKKDQIIKDLKKFWPYVTVKSEREYKNSPTPSATHNIQLPSSQFHVVSNTLEKALIKHEIRKDHVAQLCHDSLEVIEESRSQTNDDFLSVLDSIDVDSGSLQLLMKRQKVYSEITPAKEVHIKRGLSHDVWVHVDHDEKHLLIEGKIYIRDTAFEDQIEDIIFKQNQQHGIVRLKLQEEIDKFYLYDRHILPFANGVPVRLLVKYLKRFSMELHLTHNYDSDKILLN